jgi:hypothetical protein
VIQGRPAGRRPPRRVDEGGKVVLRLALELCDSLGCGRLGALADFRDRIGRHPPELGPSLERRKLDVQPSRELAFFDQTPAIAGRE